MFSVHCWIHPRSDILRKQKHDQWVAIPTGSGTLSMRTSGVYLFTGIIASLGAGILINLIVGIGADRGVATLIAITAINIALLVTFKERFSLSIQTLIYLLIGAAMAGVFFFTQYYFNNTGATITAADGIFDYIVYFINIAVLIPLFEEITVRKLLFVGASRYIGPIFSALIVSVIFAMTHKGVFTLAFIFSATMCLMAWKGINYYDRAILHGSYNGILSMLWIISGTNATLN